MAAVASPTTPGRLAVAFDYVRKAVIADYTVGCAVAVAYTSSDV